MTFNKKILHTLVVLSIMFLGIAGYLTYFQVVKAPQLATSGQNPRTLIKENMFKRGSIYDKDGVVLAESKKGTDGYGRAYPYKDLYSHLIGYTHPKYGRSALESEFNSYLSGGTALGSVFNVWDRVVGGEEEGANLTLTVKHSLQKKADELLGGRTGSVVAINPKTGEVLALVSKPGFDTNPSYLEKNWDMLSQSEENVLLPRATMGVYPPGSTFKPIVAAMAIESGLDKEKYTDSGSIIIDGKEFTNNKGKVYDEITIDDALAYSVNTMFISLADTLGQNRLMDIAGRFYIGREIPFDLPVSKGNILTVSNPCQTDVASIGIGQGDLQVTPMHMAVMMAAIANDGVMMRPFVVSGASLENGISVYKAKEKKLGSVTTPRIAEKVLAMMEKCVTEGTGKNAEIPGVRVVGKTGTAENEREKNHAWFVACAIEDEPEIAVSVMLEYDGTSGSEACVPIARELIKTYLKE